MFKVPKIRSLHIFAISPVKTAGKVDFLHGEKHKSLMVSLWLCTARHAQSTQNNKFTISLQYLKENIKDEVVFLPADNHQRILQMDTTLSFKYKLPDMPKLLIITSLLFCCSI